MTNYNVYPDIPKESSALLEPQPCCLNIIKSKQQGLLKLEERYSKYSKYSKISDRLVWLNACSSSLSMATGISSVATLSTFIGLPVNIPLAVVSLAGASISGVTTAIAAFETSVSKALRNGEIDEREYGILQELHLKVIKELSNLDRKIASKTRNQSQKNLLEEINKIKKTLTTRDV